MKVFVTGGCGFLGSHVCEYYIKKGAEVISYDNMTKYELERTGFTTEAARDHNWNFLKDLGVSMVKADIRDTESLLDNAQGCDYIIHTAAQPAMTISWENPSLDISTNVLGTFNILETARQLDVPVAICATVHVYGNSINSTLTEGDKRYIRNPDSINEKHPILEGTLSPLHASKAAGDTYLKAWVDTYNLKGASFRLTGIYGTRQFGGEDHGWVANFSIRSVMNWPITLFGTGKQVRDIIYATDVCEAFDAFYKTRNSGIFNIGGGTQTAISLLECIDIIEKLEGKRPDVQFAADRHGDLRYFICNIEKAQRDLNWSPKILPKEGILHLLEWIRSNVDSYKKTK
jgi:CDP-paratose 2-epimerase